VIRGSKKTTELLLSSLLVGGVALYGTKGHGTRRTVFFNCVEQKVPGQDHVEDLGL